MRCLAAGLLGGWILAAGQPPVYGAADLYIQDTPADTGIEPNPDTGPMWVSEDIWVRQNAIPGYQPYPFTVDPAWLTAISPLHQNPEYRDPKYSRPNYVYVRVRNRGSTASAGTERLRVYWAKASTGLSWPGQWVDYVAAHCGPDKLYGLEITKPRRNLADVSVPQSEVNEYSNAIVNIGTVAAYRFPDGVQYWHKQQTEHAHVVNNLSPSFTAHGSDGFGPWHREFINRYELLLREAFPRVTLFYWDWRTDPRTSSRITTMMGSFSGPIGAPFNALAPPSVSRLTGTDGSAPTPTLVLDSTIVGQATFTGNRTANESPHNRSHVYVGGTSGNISFPAISTQDPFFFLLHGNADRLWAMWQRANPSRYDPATAYSGTLANMTDPMAPWNGLRYNGSAATIGNPVNGISPWTTADGYITMKPANDPSVVFPPIYDTAPLTLPPLQAGESVVIQIPWYPPNPADFSCFGADQGHVCLLARIETSTSAPYGMTFAEGSDVNLNTKNNNNIAWKNITVQDLWPGPFMLAPAWLHNLLLQDIIPVRLNLTLPPGSEDLFNFGDVFLDLKPELFARWMQNGAVGQGFERVGGSRLQLFGTDAFVANIPLFPDEVQQVEVQLRLRKGYPDPQGRAYHVDLAQFDQTPGAPDQLIGGVRATFDFNKLCLVGAGSSWRYLDTGRFPGEAWRGLNYDDSAWLSGPAKLGFGDGDEATVIDGGAPGARHITTWFRRTFTLDDPSLYRNLWLRLKADDGAVVYLNGVEMFRLRMPAGSAITPDTPASVAVSGLAGELFYPVDVSNFIALLASNNVVAVEVHQASPDSPDLGFDLELCANLGSRQFPPQVSFLSPPDASLFLAGQPIRLLADAMSPADTVRSVDFFSDGKQIGSAARTPYTLNWSDAPLGSHQITAVATDGNGLTGSAFITAQVLSNLPPFVSITSPAFDQMFGSNAPIPFVVQARDVGGSIRQVDFYRKAHVPTFNEPEVLVGTLQAPPFGLQINPLPPGEYMLTAVATDDEGASTYSMPVHIHVMPTPAPRLTIRYAPPMVIIDWTPPEAILEQAPSATGPWQSLANVPRPWSVQANGQALFFRARLP